MGAASVSSSTAPTDSPTQGCAWTSRLQRQASVRCSGRGARRGTIPRSGGSTDPASNTTSASGTPSSSGRNPRPTPSRASAPNPAAISPRQRVISMRSRTNPISAGSSVTEATIVAATVSVALTASPVTKGSPTRTMPSSEITTIVPANMTERPAVSIAMNSGRDDPSPPPLWIPSR